METQSQMWEIKHSTVPSLLFVESCRTSIQTVLSIMTVYGLQPSRFPFQTLNLVLHFSITINAHLFFPPSSFASLSSCFQRPKLFSSDMHKQASVTLQIYHCFFIMLFPFLLLLLLLLPTRAFPFQHTLWVVFDRTLF